MLLSSLNSKVSEVQEVAQSSSNSCSSESEDKDNYYLCHLNNIRAHIKYLMETCILEPNCVHKLSQLYLVLVLYKQYDSKHFWKDLCIASKTFDQLLKKIADNLVFISTGSHKQIPVDEQLTIALYHFGHFRNAASVEAIGQWAGVSASTVVICTCHVQPFLISYHHLSLLHHSVRVSSLSAKECVEAASCVIWHDGWLLVNGALVPLTEKPDYHGEAYFDHKSNYSLNVQLITLPNLYIVDYVIGHCGSAHNSMIWANSAYPIEAWCVTSYKKPASNVCKNMFFNFWVSNVCIHLEHAVGLFKSQFQSLKGLQQQIKNNQDYLHTLE
ncbi:hypothetical protein AN958_06943 [Leucoagaricus sp. SymC.cos]|nr:hypothetical protein AN958_06943 [Leucoagaricus sp. SymC.cos]